MAETLNELEKAEFLIKDKMIEQICGNPAGFCICIDYDNLNDILSTEQNIVIAHDRCIVCFDDGNRKVPPDYYHISSNMPHTNKSVVQHLVKIKFDARCNHLFLEGFDKKSEAQFNMSLGS